MSHTTSIRRAVSIAGATGILAFSMAGPGQCPTRPRQRRPSRSGAARPPATRAGRPAGPTGTITVDDNAVEILQLGAGVLAGVALAGAGWLRRRRPPAAATSHPA